MPKCSLNWVETDVQFLEALLLATGGEGGTSTLQDILLMADAVDGTIFMLKEIEQALEKLVAIQYVSVQKNKLSLSLVFQEAHAKVEENMDEQEQLLQSLQGEELTEQKIEEAKSILKKYKLKNYYQQYQEQFGG